MVKKTTLIQKIKEIIQKEWKSKNTVLDVIKKQLIKKKNKPFWLFFFILKGTKIMIKKLILGTMQTNCYVIYNDNHECFIIDPGAQGQKVAKFLSNINSWGQMWLLIMLILIVYNNLAKTFAHSKNYKYFCNSKKQHLNKQYLT